LDVLLALYPPLGALQLVCRGARVGQCRCGHPDGLMLERAILLAPDAVARRAAPLAGDKEQRWMLCQSREVRASYCREAFGRGELAEQVWMLRQPDPVRESYISEVLEAPG
jgi:hypothetical protein